MGKIILSGLSCTGRHVKISVIIRILSAGISGLWRRSVLKKQEAYPETEQRDRSQEKWTSYIGAALEITEQRHNDEEGKDHGKEIDGNTDKKGAFEAAR